jgi:predicted secreted protein
MTITSALAVYFVLWWIVLFAVLPWGVRSQEEHGDVVPGSEAGAPHRPLMGRKLVATTVVSAVIFVLLYAIIAYGGLTLDDIPFLPDYTPEV